MSGSTITAPFNGKTGEFLRWTLAFVVAALVSYFTAMNAIDQRVTAVETKQQTQFDEVMRSLLRIETDVRELRNKGK